MGLEVWQFKLQEQTSHDIEFASRVIHSFTIARVHTELFDYSLFLL